jgi:hypothetical protein
MPLFVCRWQNGDFSAVYARSRDHAIMLLDEVDNAELGDLFTVKDFMAHFRLKKEPDGIDDMVPVELEEFGEDTLDMLSERVYPVFSKAVIDVDKDWPDDEQQVPPEKWDAGMNRVNDALSTERTRPWGAKEPKLSSDPEAARLQQEGHRISRALAEHVVKEHRRTKLIQMRPKTNAIH